MRDQLRISVFTIVEAVTFMVWLVLVDANMAVVGIVILVVASFIEHTLAVALARKQTARA